MNNEVTAYLALYLDAPLQSWGYQSRFDRRTTLSYPTRSGIIGLICAAMGIDRDDAESLEQFRRFRMTALTFRQEPVLIDFHTVGGGYDREKEEQFIPHTAEGKLRPPGKETVPTHREYLQHSRFGVVLEGTTKVLQAMADALANPKWGIWLGRKACVPASPVGQGVFDSYEDAVRRLEERAEGSASRVVREVEEFADGTDTLMDRPLDFKKRDFAPRRVHVGHP